MNQPKSLVLVGTGAISDAWFPAIASENLELRAVVDLDPERAAAQLDSHGISAPLEQNLAAALDRYRPDFVLDLTPPEVRVNVTGSALTHGIPVLCEKPLATSRADAQKLLQLSERSGQVLAVSQSRRWEPIPATVQAAVASGILGAITEVHCDFFLAAHFEDFSIEATSDPEQTYATKTRMRRREMQHPLLEDMAVHHFDMARFFTGTEAKSVFAFEHNPPSSWYAGGGAATCIFRMESGIVFTYRGSWIAEGLPTPWNGRWRIVGEHGSLEAVDDSAIRIQRTSEARGFRRPLVEVDFPTIELPAVAMHGALQHFLDCLARGLEPNTSARRNLGSLKMVLSAIESAEQGREVTISSEGL